MPLFTENTFALRLRAAVSEAWSIFQAKVGGGVININKEASMQLHFAYIMQNLIPLIIFKNDETVLIELETGKKLKDGMYEIDVFISGKDGSKSHTIAIEMKCYREFASSGGKRGATDIFMKDVYEDLETLEKYLEEHICDQAVFFAMNDLDRLVNPKDKSAKCWDYDISQGYKVNSPKHITTPIGGKEIDITLKNNYDFKWQKNGKFYFLELYP